MSSGDTSLEKGLAILELLNSRATMRVKDLHTATGIPKPTIVRLLGTLETRGFVKRVSRTVGYSIASRVLSLSSGFHGVPLLVEVAAPLLDRLTEKVLWPASLATLDIDAMVVRYSTIPISPLSHTQSTLHRRLHLGHRAHGRAYLAFCPTAERQVLLNMVDPETAEYLQRHIPRFRRQGWAERNSQLDPQTTSIAAPVFGERQRVIATLGITYFPKAVSDSDRATIAEELKATSAAVSAALPRFAAADPSVI